MSTPNLLELLLNLLRDPTAYREDPEGFLSSCGDVSPEDIREALILLQDKQDADFGRVYNTGGNQVVHVPPPPPAAAPEPGESNQEAAVRYLDTYVTNNYVTNEGDTIHDESVNIQADTDGGDFDLDIDDHSVTASGDGSVAAGDDIEDSDIATGDDNTIGDDNVDGDDNTDIDGDDNDVVDGDDNTAGFGDGDTSSTDIDGDVSLDDGSALAVDGDASTDSSSYQDNDTSVDASDNSVSEDNDTTATSTDNSNTESDSSVQDSDSYSSYEEHADNSSYTDNDVTTTDSHDSTQESYSAEVV